MTNFEIAFQFFRQKFDLLLVAGLFTFVFCIYVYDTNPDPSRAEKLYTLWNGLLYAFLALLGVRGATAAANIRADNVSADTIQSATTQSGDIISPKKSDAAGDTGKEKKSDETPIGE